MDGHDLQMFPKTEQCVSITAAELEGNELQVRKSLDNLPCNDFMPKHRLNENDRLDSLPAGLLGLASTNSPFSPR